jgi:hypothetical protein
LDISYVQGRKLKASPAVKRNGTLRSVFTSFAFGKPGTSIQSCLFSASTTSIIPAAYPEAQIRLLILQAGSLTFLRILDHTTGMDERCVQPALATTHIPL